MNKILILFGIIMFSLITIPLISADLLTQDVQYKIKLTFIPSCTSSCTNTTINSTNYVTCFNNCTGTIYINPGEIGDDADKNHITVIQNLNEMDNSKIFTGYKTIQIGNGSDVLNVWDKLNAYTGCLNDLERCVSSNKNVSVDLMMCQRDIGYEANYTICNTERTTLQTGNQNVQTNLEQKDKEIKDMKNQRNYWAIIGAVIGYLIFSFAVPYFKNKDTPKDASEQQFPSNAGY